MFPTLKPRFKLLYYCLPHKLKTELNQSHLEDTLELVVVEIKPAASKSWFVFGGDEGDLHLPT